MSDSPAIETTRPEEEEVVIVRRGRTAGQSRGRGRGRGRGMGRESARTTGAASGAGAGAGGEGHETQEAGEAGEGGEARGRSVDRRYRFRARLTRNGAVAIRGMNRREPDQEQVMFLSEWVQLSKFLNSKGFEKFQEHNKDKLRVRGSRAEGSSTAPTATAPTSSTAPVGPYERAAEQAPTTTAATGASIETEDM